MHRKRISVHSNIKLGQHGGKIKWIRYMLTLLGISNLTSSSPRRVRFCGEPMSPSASRFMAILMPTTKRNPIKLQKSIRLVYFLRCSAVLCFHLFCVYHNDGEHLSHNYFSMDFFFNVTQWNSCWYRKWCVRVSFYFRVEFVSENVKGNGERTGL